MELDIKLVMDGQINGDTVWICHYHRPDLNKKALRNVPPTKAIVVCNKELPDSKTIYYSVSHFRPLNKDGKMMKKYISPVDNTGYRSRSGTPLHMFDNEAECIESWNTQMLDYSTKLDERATCAAAEWQQQRDQLLSQIVVEKS